VTEGEKQFVTGDTPVRGWNVYTGRKVCTATDGPPEKKRGKTSSSELSAGVRQTSLEKKKGGGRLSRGRRKGGLVFPTSKRPRISNPRKDSRLKGKSGRLRPEGLREESSTNAAKSGALQIRNKAVRALTRKLQILTRPVGDELSRGKHRTQPRKV